MPGADERVGASRRVTDDEPRRTGRRADRAAHRHPPARRRTERRVGLDPPSLGDVGGEVLEEMGGVDRPELLGGRHDADTDVEGAVAEGEHPAVPGDRHAVAIDEVDRQLDRRGVVERRGEVVADRRGVWPRALARRAQRAPEPAVGTVGDDEVSGAHLGGRAVPLAHDDTAHEASLDDRRDGFVAVEEDRPGRDRAVGDELVEPVAPSDESVRREHRVRRPADLDVVAAPRQPDPIDALKRRQRVGVDTQLGELVNGARRERVAAGLHAWQQAPFEDRHAMAGRGEPDRGRRTGGAGTDDDRVDDVGCRVRAGARAFVAGTRIGRGHPAPAGEPGAGAVPIGMMSSTDSSSVGSVKSPASRPTKISESSAHHFANSAA